MSAIDDLMELADNYALERSFANEGECITARNALIEYAKDVEAEHMHELRAYRLTVENLEKDAARYRWLIDNAAEFIPCVIDATGILCENTGVAERAIDFKIGGMLNE